MLNLAIGTSEMGSYDDCYRGAVHFQEGIRKDKVRFFSIYTSDSCHGEFGCLNTLDSQCFPNLHVHTIPTAPLYLNCLEVMKETCYPGATQRAMAGWTVSVPCSGDIGCTSNILSKGVIVMKIYQLVSRYFE